MFGQRSLGLRAGRRRSAAFATALALCLAVAAPANAWTQLRNQFDNTNDPDYPEDHGAPESCTGSSPNWCVEWPLAGGSSSEVYVYLHTSLNQSNNQPGETLNFKTQARNAFDRWNDVPAFSPFLLEAASSSASTGSGSPYYCPTRISRGPGLPGGVLASTNIFSKADRLGSGSQVVLVCMDVYITDDESFDTDSDPNDGKPDARWTLTHELGHALALGHTAMNASMYPIWPNDAHMGINPASNDINGLQAIYGEP